MSRGTRGGRGETLRQLVLQSKSSAEQHEHGTSSSSSLISPISSRGMGRSAALTKLVEDQRSSLPVKSEQPSSQEPLSWGRSKPSRCIRTPIDRPPGRPSTSQTLPDVSSLQIEEDVAATQPLIMKGTSGDSIKVACNYIRLFVEDGKGVFQYCVDFTPEVDAKNFRFNIMKQFTDITGPVKIFDGAIMFLPQKLSKNDITLVGKLPSDESDVSVRIRFVKALRMGNDQCIQLYNLLFRKIMIILGHTLHGRHFYDPAAAMPIPDHKLEVWPGNVCSIHEFEGGVMLCCDSSHRVLRTQTVHQLMEEMITAHSSTWREDFTNLTVGQVVLTKYNNKVYKIDDIDFNSSPKNTFTTKTGEEISYTDYYSKQYDISIRDKGQPLLKSRVSAKIRGEEISRLVDLIPELCYLTGLSDAMRADMRLMKSVAQCTRVPPAQRQLALKKFIRNINSSEEAKKVLGDWGLILDSKNITLPGRVIPPENVYFNKGFHEGSLQAEWSKAVTNCGVLSGVDLTHWFIICTERDNKVVNDFLKMVKMVSPKLGIQIQNPFIMMIANDNTQNYIRCLQSLERDKYQIGVLILPIARQDKYRAIKKMCCADCPIPSQVILTRTIRLPEKLRSVTQKIVMQMNCKLGGTLWALKIPVKSAMVVGMDAYHDPTQKSCSIAAIVASTNQPLTRWYSKIFKQKPGIELIDGLEMNLIACLHKYQSVNGHFPDQIFIYRDGVGEGQLAVCQQYEIPQLLSACKRIAPDYSPKFLYVVVQKRISTRLFEETNGDYGNPPPGTIMDNYITSRDLYDFYLVSQNVRQGTVTPTHYVVIYNSTSMSPDQVQRFTYKLTHLYYNWCGTVRVPAPCQYAHKLASLIGDSVQKEPCESLSDKLFYL